MSDEAFKCLCGNEDLDELTIEGPSAGADCTTPGDGKVHYWVECEKCRAAWCAVYAFEKNVVEIEPGNERDLMDIIREAEENE